jgi:hypothetical protein
MTKSVTGMSVFIEFLAGSALAIFFHLVLHHVEAAYIIFGVGVLLSLATYLLREDIGSSRDKLCSQYNQAHEITFTVAQILDQECRDKAQEILAGTQRTLTLLLQGYVPLDENEFYLKGTRYFDESERQVKTVDPVSLGWDSRGALLNYYQANLRAMERGVKVTRIFVLSRHELADSEVQKVLLLHLRDGIEVRVAHRDELPTVSDVSSLDSTSSFDFAIYDDKLATEVFGLPGKYFGRQTRDPALVGNYQHLFDLIKHASHSVAMEGDRILLAGELLPLGS